MNLKSSQPYLIIILAFLIAVYGNRILSGYFMISFSSDYLKIGYYYTWWIIPSILVTGGLYGFKNIFRDLGLDKSLFSGLVFALIAVLPMLVSSAIMGQIGDDLKVLPLLRSTLFAGFMEEYLFRGFLFGLLFRKAGWGFIPAAILGALIFGLGHIYQGSTLLETAVIFFITAMGAVWFAWLYIEWNNNLWAPVFLHIMMNLSWTLFEVSSNALGGLYINLFRAMTIALAIVITVRYSEKSGLRIKRSNLIVNAKICEHEIKQ